MYGQVVVGPPGSGKSTYCDGVQQLCASTGRPLAIVNLDPANEQTPYDCAVDVRELITVQDVMTHRKLGPNAALIFAMEYIETRMQWLQDKLQAIAKQNSRTYLLIDFPGQVELFTVHDCVHNILDWLHKQGHELTAVHLCDSQYATEPGKFVSVLLCSLMAMCRLQLPHINLLSKADLLASYGPLPFDLRYFTEVHDLRYLLELLQDDPFLASYKQLSEQLVSVIEDYSLVSFQLLSVQDVDSLTAALALADQANGRVYQETDAPDLRAKALHKANNPINTFNMAAHEKYGHLPNNSDQSDTINTHKLDT